MLLNRTVVIVSLLLSLFSVTSFAATGKPIATDSRIKTLVYSENEVFRIVVHYGYQASIELANGEEIETVSLGSSFVLEASPIGRRLFLKPLEDNAQTNMTVITNRRAYQFDVQTKSFNGDEDDAELAYVIRFYYPSDDLEFDMTGTSPEAVYGTSTLSNNLTINEAPPRISSFNFSYSLVGPDRVAPIRVFDDGQSTYLQFADDAIAPSFSIVENNKEQPIYFKRLGPYYVINRVLGHFMLRSGYDLVCVYNEQKPL